MWLSNLMKLGMVCSHMNALNEALTTAVFRHFGIALTKSLARRIEPIIGNN